jgi:hypothetical protein
MIRIFAASMFLSLAAVANENPAPVLVISPVAGSGGVGAMAGFYRDEGKLRYGVSALGTGGYSRWAGASLDARWSLFDTSFTPYFGAGMGAFSITSNGIDLGIQPTLSFEAGVELGHFFAGGRMLLPLATRTTGIAPHDSPGLGSPALLAQIGFSL